MGIFLNEKRQKIVNNNSPQKIRILGTVCFWLLGYSIIVITLFSLINFDVVSPKDNFLALLSRPFLPVLLFIFPWFYIFPLLVAAAPSIKRLIFSILLSILLFSPGFFVMSWGWGHGYTEEANTVLAGMIIQLILCLILSSIFNAKKEKIIPKLLLISLVFFFSIFTYITISAKVASEAGPVLGKLFQEAIKTRDVSLCGKILEESKKRKVYAETRHSLCQNYHRKCVLHIAIETNNIEVCKKIFGGAPWIERIKCVGTIAKNTNNPNLCVEAGEIVTYRVGELGISECLEIATQLNNN